MSVHAIVGAGQAGTCAAFAMREAGFAGRIVLIGEEPDHPYERPPLSKAVIGGPADARPPVIYADRRYKEQDITTRLGVKVVGADAKSRMLVLNDGERIQFDRLLIATGARPRRLAIPGNEHLLVLRTLADALRIRPLLVPGAHIACIGAGTIGMELAASAHGQGCAVTVVEAGAEVMQRALCEQARGFLEAFHRKAGIGFRFKAMPSAVTRLADGRKSIMLQDGSEIVADCVVCGIGIERNVELAQLLGAETDDGILVDEFGRTSLADIFAAGDVAAFWHPDLGRRLRLESWRHALNHGIAVGRAMCGPSAPYTDHPWFWTDQFELNVQVSGQPALAHHSLYRTGDRPNSFIAYHLDAEETVVAATAVNDPRAGRAAQALIRSKSGLPETHLSQLRSRLQA